MGDNISRQAAIEAIDRIFDRCEEIEAHLPEGDPDRTGYKMYPDYMTVWEYLHQVSYAEPKTGRWVGADSQCGIGCPFCGTPVDDFCHSTDYIDLDYEPNFCPNCGADMRGGKNEIRISDRRENGRG